MRTLQVTVCWKHGLHMLPASRLAQLAKNFRASVRVICRDKVADAASVLSLLVLSASFGSTLTIETSGEEEAQAVAAIERFFAEEAD